ncbi:MAG: DNA/RNA non-specific endonuclease [Acidobacteria bacterium]|nr:DNA/RNA non-specific endonuclease [Acidobacteriota bacterium]
MKNISFGFSGVVALALFFAFGSGFDRSVEARDGDSFVSPNLVISQIYGGGGLTGAQYTNDFVEIFNRGNSPVSLSGWSTQYASFGGTEFLVTPLGNVTLQPGQYYLIQYASGGATGAALPTPDLIAPAVTNNAGNTFIPNLSSTTGKLALVNSTVRLPASTCPVDPTIVDLVGYGATASCFEGTRAVDLTATTAIRRNGGGCTDTDNNLNDFVSGAPAPRNIATPANSCNLGGNLQAGIQANPATITPGGNTLLTVSVIPATSPPSTGITVVGNLSDIGGSASQTFFDNGTNGDVTPNDNVFSFLATVPPGTSGGSRIVTAVASDAQARSVNLNQNLTINAPLPDEDPLILGNPSGATPDIANENNYLMQKAQYSLSYSRATATPNWVAWRLDSTWVGTAPRQDDYRGDPAVPAGWYQVQDNDYSGSGYDRGHMCPSGDRTRSIPDNSATFLMTNFVPQLPANNQGPWNDFENYCRTVADQGNELYIFSGGQGNAGTIAAGRIVVPQVTWKVVLIIPNGTNDLQRVNKATRTIAIVVPNQPPVTASTPWRQFRTTVKAVEALTGHNFFSNVPKNTQEIIERRRDTQ